jgi:hypothetical protein
MCRCEYLYIEITYSLLETCELLCINVFGYVEECSIPKGVIWGI